MSESTNAKITINAETVRLLLVRRGMEQKDLAEKSGLSEQTITKLMNGKPFASRSLGKIAGALDVNPIDLIRAEGFPDPLVVASADAMVY